MVRMRTAQGVLDEVKKFDPETALTLSAIRRYINSGAIPVVQVGTKKLVDLDLFYATFLCPAPAATPERQTERSRIRRLEV